VLFALKKELRLSEDIVSKFSKGGKMDSIDLASSLGRLDFVSALLASIAVMLAIVGIYSLFSFKASVKKVAKYVAKEAAESIAKEKAEEIAIRVSKKVAKETVDANLFNTVEDVLELRHGGTRPSEDDPSTIVDDGLDNKLDDNN